jgi:hypothetical protein
MKGGQGITKVREKMEWKEAWVGREEVQMRLALE